MVGWNSGWRAVVQKSSRAQPRRLKLADFGACCPSPAVADMACNLEKLDNSWCMVVRRYCCPSTSACASDCWSWLVQAAGCTHTYAAQLFRSKTCHRKYDADCDKRSVFLQMEALPHSTYTELTPNKVEPKRKHALLRRWKLS